MGKIYRGSLEERNKTPLRLIYEHRPLLTYGYKSKVSTDVFQAQESSEGLLVDQHLEFK